jgi:hypothetical protein
MERLTVHSLYFSEVKKHFFRNLFLDMVQSMCETKSHKCIQQANCGLVCFYNFRLWIGYVNIKNS